MKLRLFILLITFNFCAMNAQEYVFGQYTTEHGLVHDDTYDILQAKNGVIWIATYGGVSTFDGSSFINFTTDDGLASDFAYAVFEDSQERIWVGTLNNGISIIEDEKIWTPTDIDYFKYGTVTEFYETQEGVIYIFANGGIVKYEDEIFVPVIAPTDRLEDGIYVQDVAMLDEHTFVMASTRKGVIILDLDTCDLTYMDDVSHGINKICFSIHVDEENALWVGSYGALYKFKNGKKETFVPDWNDFGSNKIWRIFEDENELYIATEGNGMLLFDKQKASFEIVDEHKGFPNKYAYTVMKDREDNFWFTTFGGGIVRYRDSSFRFYDQEQGLPKGEVTSIESWNDLWAVGTENGLAILDGAKIVDTLFKGKAIGSLNVSSSNELLLVAEDVYALSSLQDPPRLVHEGSFFHAYDDDENTILSGGNKGLNIIRGGAVTEVSARKSARILPLGDRYLNASQFGLFQLYQSREDSIPGLPQKHHDAFYTMDSISRNEVITINDKNLYYLKNKEKAIDIEFYDLDSLELSESIEGLRIDKRSIWTISADEISKVSLDALLDTSVFLTQHFALPDHFKTGKSINDELFIDAKGQFVWATTQGMGVFSEEAHKPNTQPPILRLNDVYLFAEKLDQETYWEQSRLELPYKKNYLSFEMQAVTFSAPESVKYKHRLKGLRGNDTWSSPTVKNMSVYSYLPPGDYVFEFTADNGNGVWQEEVFQYPFRISVPFWRTIWFWAAFLSTLFGMAFFALSRKNALAQKRQQQITQDIINAQEEERSRVARELHDSVGQKLMMLTRKVKYFKNPETNALAGSTLAELRSISRGLHPAVLERLGFTAALEALIEEMDEHSDTFVSSEIENVDVLISKASSLHIYRIVQELLSNMIKHSAAKAARIELYQEGQVVKLSIQDNGKGFDYEQKLKTTKSLGMKSILERCKMIHGKLDITSEIGKGTTYVLTLASSST